MPRNLVLTEFRPSDPIDLSQGELEALLRIASIRVTPASPGRYILVPGSQIGALELGDLSIVIRPKIRIEQVLFLISYAVDPQAWDRGLFRYSGTENVVEAIVPAFTSLTRRAIARGLLQGYSTEEQSLPVLRGRLRFDEQIRRRYGQAPPAECRYDEFTEDVTENRLLRAANRALSRTVLRSTSSRRSLRLLDVALERVADVDYDPRSVPHVQFTRLNAHYRPAVELSRLILAARAFELDHGEVTGTGFLLDMNDVFELFVIVALREALGLSAQDMPRGSSGRRLFLDDEEQVRLRPDISWWTSARCIFVGDAKYKRLHVAGFEHGDLYQLHAYATAADLPGGILVYAVGEHPESTYEVRNAGKRLEVATVSLDGSPEAILARITAIAQRVLWFASRSLAAVA